MKAKASGSTASERIVCAGHLRGDEKGGDLVAPPVELVQASSLMP